MLAGQATSRRYRRLRNKISTLIDAWLHDIARDPHPETTATHVSSSRSWCDGDHTVLALSSIQARGVLHFGLFIGTPGVSAAVAGWALVDRCLTLREFARQEARRLGGWLSPPWHCCSSHLCLQLYVWTQPIAEHWSIVDLTFLVLVGGMRREDASK